MHLERALSRIEENTIPLYTDIKAAIKCLETYKNSQECVKILCDVHKELSDTDSYESVQRCVMAALAALKSSAETKGDQLGIQNNYEATTSQQDPTDIEASSSDSVSSSLSSAEDKPEGIIGTSSSVTEESEVSTEMDTEDFDDEDDAALGELVRHAKNRANKVLRDTEINWLLHGFSNLTVENLFPLDSWPIQTIWGK